MYGAVVNSRVQTSQKPSLRPALIISLDFELHWGVRDHRTSDGPYRANLLGVRDAIPAMLACFAEFGISATWATVGFLFARDRAELERMRPEKIPRYEDRTLNPYDEPVGRDEDEDPLHYAASLISLIRAADRQEIGTHTYSHYYCLEAGQDRETFAADLNAAITIARSNGIELKSIVFPRNQHNPEYDGIIAAAGITCFRGNQPGFAHTPQRRAADTSSLRAKRLVSSYLPIGVHGGASWESAVHPSGMANLAASAFLRPYNPALAPLERLRLARIVRDIELTARRGGFFHLWWHPHNFGTNLPENISFLRRILEAFATQRERRGMQSLTMGEAAARVRGLAR